MRSRSTLELGGYALILGAFIFGLSRLHSAGVHIFGDTNGWWRIADLVLIIGLVVICAIILARTFRWLIAIAFCTGAIAMVIGGIYFAHASYFLAHNGLLTQGLAVKRVHHVTNHYRGFIYTGKTDDYLLDYTYTINGLSYSSQNVHVSKETWDKAETDQRLPIRYLMRDPHTNMIDLPQEQEGRYLGLFAPFFLSTLMWWLGMRWWNRASDQQVTPVAPYGRNLHCSAL